MAMARLQERIQCLEQKLSQLLANYEQQRAITQKLQQENEHLRQMIAIKDTAVYHAAEKRGMDAIIKQLAGEPGADVGKAISNYIKDIDQCIAFFERLT